MKFVSSFIFFINLIIFPTFFLSPHDAFKIVPTKGTLTDKYLEQIAVKPYLHEGMKLPKTSFHTFVRSKHNPAIFESKILTTDDYFAKKKCVIFAVPGAFTPTCSSQHLPQYIEGAKFLKKIGIDEVYCISVNDIFVLQAWGKLSGLTEDKSPGSFGFQEVNFIPDGMGTFTRKIGMNCLWDTERGFGERSWRYSAYVDNGKVKKLFLEQPFVQNSKDDPFDVSNVNTMLAYLYKQFGSQEVNFVDENCPLDFYRFLKE
jgi:peroxiredoxin (alkyl hydroperoxide reductase subunit C)